MQISDEAPDTRRFWIEVEGEAVFSFQPGQFITTDLPIGEKRLQRWRSYSIASAPNNTNVLELCILYLPGGLATEYLFHQVKVGDTLRFKGPDGNFVLPDPIDTGLVFICTGTGIAPFRSMIQDIVQKGKKFEQIHLIFGTRWFNGILYRQEFEELARTLPGFHYYVALSKEKSPLPEHLPFHVQKGYVHPIYLERFAENAGDYTFYLCGWTKMIDEAVANLMTQLHCQRTQIKYELYG